MAHLLRVGIVAREFAPEDDVVEWVPRTRTRLEHPARVAAFVMLAVTLLFPLAACVSSQL